MTTFYVQIDTRYYGAAITADTWQVKDGALIFYRKGCIFAAYAPGYWQKVTETPPPPPTPPSPPPPFELDADIIAGRK